MTGPRHLEDVCRRAAEVSRAAPFASYERRTLAITGWPYCFTDQYDVGIMYAGSVLLESDDVVSVETCRGGVLPRWGSNSRVLAGMRVDD